MARSFLKLWSYPKFRLSTTSTNDVVNKAICIGKSNSITKTISFVNDLKIKNKLWSYPKFRLCFRKMTPLSFSVSLENDIRSKILKRRSIIDISCQPGFDRETTLTITTTINFVKGLKRGNFFC